MKEKQKLMISNYWKLVQNFFIDIYGWLLSVLVLLFRNIKKVGIFHGYFAYWFAQKYSEKRTKKWLAKWDQSGKQQCILPYGETKLIVCSKLELEYLKRKHLLPKTIKPRKLIKHSYYTTAL
jgi:hypothetical protein